MSDFINSSDPLWKTVTVLTKKYKTKEQKDKAIACCKYIVKLQPKNTEAQDLLEKLESV